MTALCGAQITYERLFLQAGHAMSVTSRAPDLSHELDD